MARRRRSKKTSFSWLAVFPVLALLALLSKCGNSEKPKETPQNVETMVAMVMSQTPTPTITPTPTEPPAPTATLTVTPSPTFTPVPTDTPSPYYSDWLPEVMDQSSNVVYSGNGYISPGCLIKGNISQHGGKKIYHCPNGNWYNETVINVSKGERWFCSEQEALDAGFKKPTADPPCGDK